MDDTFDWGKNTWDVINAKFRDKDNLIAHQLDSYNDLIDRGIPQMIETAMPLEAKCDHIASYKFNVLKVSFCKPVQHDQVYKPLYPFEARMRDMNYSGTLYIDYEEQFNDGRNITTTIERKVPIGKIPIMTGSKYCHLYGKTRAERAALHECQVERGGYFIVNGHEKVLITQERPAENTVLCFKESDQTKPYVARVEIKSTIDQRFYPIKVSSVKLTKIPDPKKESGQKLRVSLPYIKKEIPLFIVFRALGVTTDKEIIEYILGDLSGDVDNELVNMIVPSALEANQKNITNELEAINYIAAHVNNPILKAQSMKDQKLAKGAEVILTEDQKLKNETTRLRYAKDIINREFIPHVGQNNKKKARFLAHMTRELLDAITRDTYADRDSYANKRKDLAGALMAQIIRFHLQKLFREIKASYVQMLEKKTSTGIIRKTIQKCTMESKLKNAMSTGNWFTTKAQADSASKKGISQVLQNLSSNGRISHLRRIQSPLERAGSKHEPPRRFHLTQIAKSDPNETPEGAQVGVVKNFALMAHVTQESNSYPVRSILFKLGVVDICEASSADIHRSTLVIVNGDLIGIISGVFQTERTFRYLKMFKLMGKISRYVSIAWLPELSKLMIQTDGGRDCHPVYVVDQNNHFKINNLLNRLSDPQSYLKKITWNELLDGIDESVDSNTAARWYPNGYNVDSSEPGAFPPQYITKGGYIEYLDTNEEQCAHIAIFPTDMANGQTFIQQDKITVAGYLSLNMANDLDKYSLMNKLREALPPKALGLLDNVIIVEYKPAKDRKNPSWTVLKYDGNLINDEVPPATMLIMTNINRFINKTYTQYTHCCPHPAMWFSVVSQMIPYPDHNQAPRNCYQSAMGKQALGIYATNFIRRLDTMANVLLYPQHPLAQTRTMKYTGLAELPHGYQAIVAIASYTGYNQEDSVLLSKAAIQRGMFNSLFYRTYSKKLQELPTGNSNREVFKIPPEGNTVARKAGSGISERYHAIKVSKNPDEDDRPIIGTLVHGNDIIIPQYKISKKKSEGDKVPYTDTSTTVRANEQGMIDYIIPNEQFPNNKNEEGHKFIKVRISELRKPVIGDKFASRAAQKGTCGLDYPESEMLFTEDGMVPDIVMNPHAIPSRMTIGHMIESLLGKKAALSGELQDCTPFTDYSIEDTKRDMAKYGFHHEGNEIMYNGQTGAVMECAIFINPTYYQRLKHMVNDKIHGRNRGPVQVLTKQPVEGRSRDGGLRFGEMERDVMIAHGSTQFLKEKMMESSDIFPMHYSKEKKNFISVNEETGVYKYGNQDIYESDDICKLNVPYALTLLHNELKTALVDIKFLVD